MTELIKKFAPLFWRVGALLKSFGFDKFWHYGLWSKAPNTVTLLENILSTLTQIVSLFWKFFSNEMKNIISLPLKFGEVYVVMEKFKAKVNNQGKQCMWIEYVVRHTVGTDHLIWKKCILWNDVIFLKKRYGWWVHVKEPFMYPVTISVDDDD